MVEVKPRMEIRKQQRREMRRFEFVPETESTHLMRLSCENYILMGRINRNALEATRLSLCQSF